MAHVGELLDKELGMEGKGHHDWDGVHAAATIDTGLRNPKKPWAKQFSWLNQFTDIISKANKFHNWGVEWERFVRVSIKMSFTRDQYNDIWTHKLFLGLKGNGYLSTYYFRPPKLLWRKATISNVKFPSSSVKPGLPTMLLKSTSGSGRATQC